MTFSRSALSWLLLVVVASCRRDVQKAGEPVVARSADSSSAAATTKSREESMGARTEATVVDSTLAPPAARPEAGATPLTLELVRAPADASVLSFLRIERKRAEHDGRKLLVLVGAAWCAPCRGFHARLKKTAVPLAVRIIEFDVDEHDEDLKAAGYVSTVIPLIVTVRPDGKPDQLVEIHSKKEEGADDLLSVIRTLTER